MYILCSMVILYLNMENETHVTKVNRQKQTYYMLNRTCDSKMGSELILTSCHEWQYTFYTKELTFAYLVRALLKPKKKKNDRQTTYIQVISKGRILVTRYETFRHIAHVYKLDIQDLRVVSDPIQDLFIIC
jgi:hypothetical protein